MMKSALPVRPALVAALLLAATLAAAPEARAQLGVAGGVNFDRIGDVSDGSRDLDFDNATGYHIGVFYDFAVGPVGVRPGVFYMDVGSFEGSSSAEDVRDNFDLSLVEVPLDLRLRFALPFVKPYVTAGPVVRFNTSNDGFGDAGNDVSLAGNVGLGTDIGLPLTGLGFFLEGRYSFGLTPIADDFEVGGVGVNTTLDDDTRLNNFMLRLGVKF